MSKIEEWWRDLCEKDDRTSPAEYPYMALITRAELADFASLIAAEMAGVARARAAYHDKRFHDARECGANELASADLTRYYEADHIATAILAHAKMGGRQ